MLYLDSIDAPSTPTRPAKCGIQGSLRITHASCFTPLVELQRVCVAPARYGCALVLSASHEEAISKFHRRSGNATSSWM